MTAPISIVHRGRKVILGRRAVSPRVLGPTRMLATRLLASLPDPAPSRDWIAAAEKQAGGSLGEMLNDRLGCHDAQTEVLTAGGWQRWPQYDGSALATMNPASGAMEYQAPRAVIRYDYDGPLVYSDHRRLNFALTPNHRMYNRPYKIPYPYVAGGGGYEPPRFDLVSSLETRVAIPGTTTGFAGDYLGPVTIGCRTWSGDDFMALLGLVLSDGWAGSTESNRHAVSYCSFVDGRRELVASFSARLGIRELPGRPGVWKFSDAPLGEWLHGHACDEGVFKSLHKRIPRIVQMASQPQIERFIEFFGDKLHGSDSEQYFTSSRGMADDLQELLLKVGKRSSICERVRESGGFSPGTNTSFTLHVRASEQEMSIISRGKKANLADDHYRGEVFCAEVPNSTLITRRDGQVLISGNCCTISGVGHAEQIWTANTGAMVTPPDSAILKGYETVDGYDPRDPTTDQGGIEADVLAAWKSNGIAGSKIVDWIPVNPLNHDHVRKAIERFGLVYIGISLPKTIQSQHVWTVDISAGDDAEAGSLGGHCVIVPAYDPTSYDAVTWGERQKQSIDFWDSYVDECYAPLSDAWCPGGSSPLGDTLVSLRADLAAVA